MRADDPADPQAYAALASVYERARPSYPRELLDLLARHVGARAGDAVTEIGAGTGRFTRLLAERRFALTALEPVAAMRAEAPTLKGVVWTDGTFERTGLPSRSQRWVVSAQAFHWAERRAALAEIRRILQPDGWLTVLWNAHHIEREPVLQRTYAMLRRHVPAYRYVDRTTRMRRMASRAAAALPRAAQRTVGRVVSGRGLELVATGDFDRLVYHEVEHAVGVDVATYVDLWRSRNRLRHIAGPVAFDAFVRELASTLERDGIDAVTVPYVCGAWSARVRTGPS